ncbi:hypothetical protein GQ43DRAFT_408776 [Delitschia confertaspora ATCC 74209]|uniref:Protein sip5 n=1 Tax=Delitschia confertaspora ATCC 74209 TaxID=1513339 RepID=A0A9P4JWM3_9PLEO|nr:hypothetical protein GQ43DRAFT_408776 [Delitschia confertaspora ATCC 74209]
MGNSSSRESRPGSSLGHSRSGSYRNPGSPTASGPSGSGQDRSNGGVYSSRNGRGSRHDLSLFGLGGSSERDPALEPRRETRAEREARKLEKERVLRAQERERSIREEGVDGGYLVTLGTYTGPEDFSKPVVRQLMVERRLAPFWKGLNDHSDMWTEHQLVAVVNGLPLPAADEIPPEEPPRPTPAGADSKNTHINHLTVPITSRSLSSHSDRSANLSPSHPAFSLPSPASPIAASTASPSSSPFFRGRAKTLAALSTSSRNDSQADMTPQEVQLPKDPYVNGQRIEVFLYKNAAECPICFLYYPPYLNKTRCCDQPICSECFVQIKRPDPHPPEHHGDDGANTTASEQPEDGQLVSEPASCPFCVQPEFGVTYEPPPFRRGLVYANQVQHPSAMSSTSSLGSQGLSTSSAPGRRRATSLAATDSHVITTDRVRPDWAKKLADARSHALRRAAAATALHNAAYMMGNLQQQDHRGFTLGRRRRTMFGSDSAGSSGHATPRRDRESDINALLGAASGSRNDGNNDLLPGRHSSRRPNRIEDLEELMMMEAIRLSLAAEEDRKKKEEKEASKEAKKAEKKKAKEAKKVGKAQRKIGSGFHPIPGLDPEEVAGSSTTAGKGKAVDRSGGYAFNADEPSSSKHDPQKHLEQSRAQIQSQTSSTGNTPSSLDPFAEQGAHREILRTLSNTSSVSSLAESDQGSLHRAGNAGFEASGSSLEPSPNASGLSINRDETPGTEPMFNFRSLAAVIDKDSKDDNIVEYTENIDDPSQGAQTRAGGSAQATLEEQAYEQLDESVATMKPTKNSDNEIEQSPPMEAVHSPSDADIKRASNVSTVASLQQEPTQ